MDKRLLFSAILVAGIGASQAQAQVAAPTLSNPAQLKLDGTDTVYVYNVKAQKWLVNGNAYGTQTSLGDKGMKIAIIPNKSNGEFNGTYSFYNDSNSPAAGTAWTRRMFFNAPSTDGGTSYVDRNNQAEWKCNWVIMPKANNSFELEADTISANQSLWETEYAEVAGKTRAGWNPNDPKLDGQGNEATSEVFRPALDMNADGASEFGIEWQAYDETEYKAYSSRVLLMKAINEAVADGIDVSKATAVYNNASATVEELDAATDLVSDLRRNAAMVTADASNPVDITEYIKNANCESLTGWEHECEYDANGNVGSGGHGTNWQVQTNSSYKTEDGSWNTTKFIERWVNEASNPSTNNTSGTGHLSDGVLSQKLTNLPAGGYKISCYAMATQQGKQDLTVEGASVFANTDSQENVQAVATKAGVVKKFDFAISVKEGESLTLGFKLDNTTANWAFVDDFTVEYYGSDAQAMYLTDVKDLASTISDEMTASEAFCPDYADAANKLIEEADGLDGTASVEKIAEVKAGLLAAQNNIKTSLAKYVELTTLVDELQEFVNKEGYNPTADFEDLYENGGKYGEGAEDLISTYTLNNEDLAAYMADLTAAYYESQKQSVQPGEDLTGRIVNPSFDTGDSTGWTGSKTVNKDYKNAEAYQATFDMYQDITNLPDGVYELSVRAFQRVGFNDVASAAHDGGTENITAFIYANDLETPFTSPYTYGMDVATEGASPADYEYTLDGKTVYIPNSMKGFLAACESNPEAYVIKVPVLVEGGTLRIGVREKTRPASSGDWAIWDDFHLTYVGSKGEALNTVVSPLIAKGQALLSEKMNADTLATLNKAVEALQAEQTIDGIHALTAAINAANTSIDAYKPLGSAIDNVKTRYTANENSYKTSDAAKAIYNAGLTTAENAYNTGSVADDKIDEAIKELNVSFTQYAIKDVIADASEVNPVDISKVIVNNDFATMDITGWTVKKGSAGFQAGNNVEAAEFYNQAFNVQQSIVGLPAGKYYIKARAFYRNGNSATATVGEDDNKTLKYDVNNNAFLYYAVNDSTQADSVALKPITACPVAEENLNEYVALGSTDGLASLEGLGYIPNNMITSQAFFKSETVGPKYDTDVLTIVYDGKSDFFIGAYKSALEANDWTIIKNFTLQYAGATKDPVTAIEDINKSTEAAIGTRIFNAAGVQVGKLQRGLNIVETTLSDGSKKVTKIIVK